MFLIVTTRTYADSFTIVINNGHSVGYDSGAQGTGITEAELNEQVATKLFNELKDKGYKVYITHSSNPDLENYKLLSNDDGSYLRKLGPAVNAVNPDLVISIHHNSTVDPNVSGTELYWSSYRDYDQVGVYDFYGLWSDGSEAYRDSSPSPEAQESLRLAQIVQKSFSDFPNLSFRKIVERDDYLPAHAKAPCILYEGGYLSNPTECEYMKSDVYQVGAAKRLANAIDTFFNGSVAIEPSLRIASQKNTLNTGEELTLNPVFIPTDLVFPLTWTSSDDNIATVSTDGIVTAINPGSVTISAQTNDQVLSAYITLDIKEQTVKPEDPDPETPEQISLITYKVYNPNSGEHFFTQSELELANLEKAGWRNEGTAWHSPLTGEPIYRLYNGKEHLYTSNKEEADILEANHNWNLEYNGGPVFYSGGNTPIYRVYNPNDNMHHLTINLGEYNILGNLGWNKEGIKLYCIN